MVDDAVRDGHEVVAQLGKGDVFGELSLLIDVQRTATVTATSDLEVMILSRKQFLECVRNDSDNALFMIQALGQRLASSTQKMTGSHSVGSSGTGGD